LSIANVFYKDLGSTSIYSMLCLLLCHRHTATLTITSPLHAPCTHVPCAVMQQGRGHVNNFWDEIDHMIPGRGVSGHAGEAVGLVPGTAGITINHSIMDEEHYLLHSIGTALP